MFPNPGTTPPSLNLILGILKRLKPLVSPNPLPVALSIPVIFTTPFFDFMTDPAPRPPPPPPAPKKPPAPPASP